MPLRPTCLCPLSDLMKVLQQPLQTATGSGRLTGVTRHIGVCRTAGFLRNHFALQCLHSHTPQSGASAAQTSSQVTVQCILWRRTQICKCAQLLPQMHSPEPAKAPPQRARSKRGAESFAEDDGIGGPANGRKRSRVRPMSFGSCKTPQVAASVLHISNYL
jgi:hypothetical protein